MDNCLFSIIVVALNAGEKLQNTIDSILVQDFTDYEIVVKDGGSRDGSFERLQEKASSEERIHLFREKDAGIYDAMNQALTYVQGEYVMFLNCGDSFASEQVLKQTAEAIKTNPGRGIYYGDTFNEKIGHRVVSAPEITSFVCFRNVPCHQACFYATSLFKERKYDLTYRIRADYEHFLWCFFRADVHPFYMETVVANYEGGGFSESKENKKADRMEHKTITKRYIPAAKLFGYRLMMVVTLAPLRRLLAESSAFSGFYQKCKEKLYR